MPTMKRVYFDLCELMLSLLVVFALMEGALALEELIFAIARTWTVQNLIWIFTAHIIYCRVVCILTSLSQTVLQPLLECKSIAFLAVAIAFKLEVLFYLSLDVRLVLADLLVERWLSGEMGVDWSL